VKKKENKENLNIKISGVKKLITECVDPKLIDQEKCDICFPKLVEISGYQPGMIPPELWGESLIQLGRCLFFRNQLAEAEQCLQRARQLVSEGYSLERKHLILYYNAFIMWRRGRMDEAIDVMGQPMYFLTVYANTMNENFTFKAYFPSSGTEVAIPVTLPFINNQVLGNPLQPYILALPSLGLTSPKNLSISVQNGQLFLAWEPVLGADYYKVYSSSDPNLPFENWDLIAPNVIMPNWTGLSTPQRKFFRVTACTGNRQGSENPPASPLIIKPRSESGKP